MYAIVQIGSTQHKVSKGSVIDVDRLDVKEGKIVNFDKVVLFCDAAKQIKVGQPFIKTIKVAAEVLKHFAGRKQIAFKYNRRKHYFRKHGARQFLTELRIKDISS